MAMTHDELLIMIEDKFDNHSGLHDAQIVNALYRVVELHKPNGFGCTANCIEVDTDGYAWKNTAYPCPTIQAIEKELP